MRIKGLQKDKKLRYCQIIKTWTQNLIHRYKHLVDNAMLLLSIVKNLFTFDDKSMLFALQQFTRETFLASLVSQSRDLFSGRWFRLKAGGAIQSNKDINPKVFGRQMWPSYMYPMKRRIQYCCRAIYRWGTSRSHGGILMFRWFEQVFERWQ